MIRFNFKPEPTLKGRAWKLLYGPAQIADGLVCAITFYTCFSRLALEVAKKVSFERMKNSEIKP